MTPASFSLLAIAATPLPSQPLFLGEGTRQEYGMIRFDAEPFDVSESYLRLMLEN